MPNLAPALLWELADMPHGPFALAGLLPALPGVYIVYRHETVLYVGKTQNLRRRWKQHHLQRQGTDLGPDTEIAYQTYPAQNAMAMALYEQHLIAALQPSLNRTTVLPQSSLTTSREAAGLTMTECAKRAGMDLSKLSRLEHGHLKLKVDDVVTLARVLGCNVEDLILAIHEPDISQEEPTHA